MKTSDYYAKALSDPAYRQEQLQQARSMRQMTLWIGGFFFLVWVGFAIYMLITAKRWPGVWGLGIPFVSFAIIFAQTRSRITVLEAMPAPVSGEAAE